jgi:hypothetical protein
MVKKGESISHKLTIDLSASEHKRIKMAASMMGTTIKNTVLLAFETFMQRKFNKATKKALKMSEGGKGLKKFKNLEELFEDLGI